ncbi:hypothetical protein [Tissierella sp. Yu-01]|uniref:hypothetical protein n=1 Tax=Tissierella sp. Yu-01 TaxID=3035694 RepID=UPI00240D26E3|nr:hypothetical protein [Tissierella sp. Yu-01]WFA09003.1 hypothetical protein P3962_00100 [Tissierella sp. Yu-01]
MTGILSIDFDYFIDITAMDRDRLFPAGSDEVPQEQLVFMWNDSYNKYPEIKDIDVIDEYYYLKKLLEEYDIKKSTYL